jgi:hypothetical protein
LVNEFLVARRDVCHSRRNREPVYCVNPDHFMVMTKLEYGAYNGELCRAAARQRALEQSQ